MTLSYGNKYLKRLWDVMPCCECCSGASEVCTRKRPCDHCRNFLDFIVLEIRDAQLRLLERVKDEVIDEDRAQQRVILASIETEIKGVKS